MIAAEKGRAGEDAALLYLQNAGLTLVERNFRVPRVGEIDLILRDGDTLVFAEVKQRSLALTPAQAVTAGKRGRLVRTAEAYLHAQGQMEQKCRFDVVEVYSGEQGRVEIRWIPEAFWGKW